jgi:hypothetical protein
MIEKNSKDPTEDAETATLLDQTFQQITQRLRQREKELDERERELDHQQKALKHDNPLLGKSTDVIRLNVTGTQMDILRRTLTSVEGSLLAAQFSGRWDESLAKDHEGNFLINQPYELWKPMVDYLLDKECETPLSLGVDSPVFDDDRLTKRFYRMVEYYQMTLGIYPFHVCKINSPEGIGAVVASYPNYSVEIPDCFASFAITQGNNSHARRILSFEITLGAFTSVSVGWASPGVKDLYQEYSEGRGVGYAGNSIALDCTKSSMVHKLSTPDAPTVTTHIPGLSLAEGSVIRCEDYGHKWYVDGKLAACAGSGETEGVRSIPGWPPATQTAIPFISAQGCFRVSKIELAFP